MHGLAFCGYAAGGQPDPALVVPIDFKRASIPAEGHRPQPISRFLPWPWCEIFSEEGVQRYLVDDTPLHSHERTYDSFATEQDRVDLYLGLHSRGMLDFRPVSSSRLPQNGMFGVTKPAGDIRIIGDNRDGNLPLISMAKLGRVASAMIEQRGGEDAPGRRRKVLDLFNATGLSSLPTGSVSKTTCDMSDYFHFLSTPHALSQHQRLRPILASRVGLDSAIHGRFVVPALTTLVMGMRFSTLIAQLVHERLLIPFLTRRLRFHRPQSTPKLFLQAAQDLASISTDGVCVPLGSVPAALLCPLLEALASTSVVTPCPHVELLPSGLPKSMATMMIPFSMFRNIPAPASAPADGCFLLRGWDIRESDLTLAMGERPTCSSDVVDFLFMLYIDDHHDLVQGPVSQSRPLTWLESVADWVMLGSALACVKAGFCIRQKKLNWASSVPSKTLGIVIDMTGPFTTFYPCPVKTEALVQVSWDISRRAGRLIRVGTVVRAASLWVWGMLTRRLLLSVFKAVYHWSAKRSMNTWAVLPRVVAGEFLLALSLAPCCYGIAAPYAPKVMAFDSSLTGFGVSYRTASPAVLAELSARVERHGSWTAFETDEKGVVADARVSNRLVPSVAQLTADWLLSDWEPGGRGWRMARAGAWRVPPQHITLGEINTSYMAGEHVASRPRSCVGFRTIFLGDNQASLGALSKGRSSVPVMGAVCRRWLSLSLVASIFPTWVYIRSKANPSDVGSRMFRWDPVGRRQLRVLQPNFSRPASEWIEDLTTHGDVENHPGPRRSFWQGRKIRPEDVDYSGVLGLMLRSVTPKTAAGYLTAALAFKRWVVAFGLWTQPLDQVVAQYVSWSHDTGEVSKGQVSHLLCAIAKFCPRYKRLGVLDDAWVAMSGWSRLRRVKSYLPVSQHIAFGCALELQRRGFVGGATAILVAFDCYLRRTDCCSLQCKDVAFRGDPRLVNMRSLAAVCLRYTKAQRPQWVEVRCVHAVAGLRLIVAGKCGNDLVFGLRGDQLLALFKRAQRWLGFASPPFRLHGLRGGGATHDRVHQILSFLEIQLRGRWSGRKITLHYIQESQAMLLQLTLPEAVASKVAIVRAALDAGVLFMAV